jgi:DNA-binding NarL/FixJ family response regulator
MPHTILIVDDHRILRDGVQAILERGGEFRVVGTAENAADALRLCKKYRPELVLMDIGLSGMSGIDATSEILRHCAETKVVILSMYDDEQTVVEAIRSGAQGYVIKKASDTDLLNALRAVLRGGSYLSPEVSDRIIKCIKRGDGASQPAHALITRLSPREIQVLRLVAEGKTSKDVAVLLDLGLQTVRTYRKTMMKKLGVSNVAGLTQVALAAGLTRLPSARPEVAEVSAPSGDEDAHIVG